MSTIESKTDSPVVIFRIILSAALVPALLSCAGHDAGPARRTLVDSRDTSDPRSLDPALSTDVPTGRVVAYLFDGLVRVTESADVVPNLAQRWELSEDARRYTFHLRTDVSFHDGRAFGAPDVEHSFKRALDPKTGGGRGWPLYPIDGAREFADGKTDRIRGLRIVNDSTIEIVLAEPLAIFPKMLAMPVAAIVPRGTPADIGPHPIGTGPWKFVQWQHDDFLRFVRNDDYHGEIPREDSLEARILPDASTAVAEFESGRVDLISIPAQETRRWEAHDELRPLLHSAPSLRLIYAALNVTRGPLRDVRVRQAINYAVDTRMILDKLLGGRGIPAAGVIAPSLEGYDADRGPYPYDTARAKQLLAEAGYPNGIDLELWCSTSEPFPRMAQTIQAYLKRVNIRITIVQRDPPSMREAARKGSTDIALKDWYADYPDAEAFLFPLLHSDAVGAGGNVSFYRDATLDTLITNARTMADSSRRVALYRTADRYAFEQAPMLFMCFFTEVYALQPWIRGFAVPSIFNGQRWNTVSIERPAPPPTE